MQFQVHFTDKGFDPAYEAPRVEANSYYPTSSPNRFKPIIEGYTIEEDTKGVFHAILQPSGND